ncbi:hypothetical protein ACFOOP_17595 [Marinicaulis aureus]|uniref:Uncharacterized protein n=1 Tax=Hyphococcus aureus TaxID=2666033 RepID=A0ABW1L1W6_9PROT
MFQLVAAILTPALFSALLYWSNLQVRPGSYEPTTFAIAGLVAIAIVVLLSRFILRPLNRKRLSFLNISSFTILYLSGIFLLYEISTILLFAAGHSGGSQPIELKEFVEYSFYETLKALKLWPSDWSLWVLLNIFYDMNSDFAPDQRTVGAAWAAAYRLLLVPFYVSVGLLKLLTRQVFRSGIS